MGLLDGKVIVITGAGQGIGRSEAELCASLGAKVVVNDVGCDVAGRGSDASVAESVAAAIRASGGEAVASSLDASLPENAAALISLAVTHFGHLSGLVCNAGIQRDGFLTKMSVEDFRAVLDTSLVGPFALLQAAAAQFITQESGGAVVLTTSPAAFFGSARQANLASAWAGIVGLARTGALELRRHRVRVNVIAPTARTRATEQLPTFQNIQPDSLAPAQVAHAVAFLLSDAAEAVSGEVLGAAGGRLYAFRSRETTGTFTKDAEVRAEDIGGQWPAITRT